jgi:anti-sigma B factor antagonist
MDLRLATRALPGKRAVLQVDGRLDAVNAPAVRAAIQKLVEQGRVEIVCDLGQVSFLDGSGLSALVTGRRAALEHGGFLKLVGLDDQAAGVFRRTGLDHLFEIHPSVEEALA